ncbi:hypothetical protein NHX12_014524 [Muraenolepis orangiensis]|uniref:Ig-like domain-containing protein n=1 Tax=Muraenolepis orangiensis TaxID=630683 RepID=A0A9Q0DCD5_9TELE|nr:hypothetical protein NHX12_014524 [Muraenolepis orangiensis]
MPWTAFMAVVCGCWALPSSYSQDVLRLRVGADCSLKSQRSTDDVIATIEWLYGSEPVVDWRRDSMTADFRGHLQDRALLDVQTGDLLISGTRASDSGVYTALINSVQTREIDVVIISVVPVPTVSWACLPGGEGTVFCVLTCEGDTSGAGPVHYSWSPLQPANLSADGDAHANQTLPKTINITLDAGSDAEAFICTIWNTISLQRSEPSTRPPAPREILHPMKGLIVFVSFIVAVVAAITLHRCWTGDWFFQKESMPWQAGNDPENTKPKELEELKANPEVRLFPASCENWLS